MQQVLLRKIQLVPVQQKYWAIAPISVLQRKYLWYTTIPNSCVTVCDTTVKNKGFVRTQGFILLDKNKLERTNKHNHIFIMQNWILLTFLTTCKEKAFSVSWMCTEQCRMNLSQDAASEVALTWRQSQSQGTPANLLGRNSGAASLQLSSSAGWTQAPLTISEKSKGGGQEIYLT